jgi:ABC-type transporter Mla subunit MlaD
VKRLLAILVLAGAVAAIAVLGSAAGNSDGGDYQVRALFRNAFSIIPGEDVKIAGVKVGKIKSLSVTKAQQAAVVLDITKPGFQDFRSDAECTIRPQSLIGEKFVECTPTQPRPEGAPEPPALEKIRSGDGKGQYLLPVTNTSRPVDIDLVGNILRLPYRQRFTILLNEFGTALAGRGQDLREVIRNADPALKETDRVLAILSGQNKVLAKLAKDSDQALAPLAQKRNQVADFIQQANTTAQATAERSKDLEAGIQRLPATLRQLKPTLQQLGALSDQFAPVLQDLDRVAPDVNRFIEQLGPFSQSGTPALQSLGSAADVGRPALLKSRPIIQQLGKFATAGKPLARNLNEITASLKDTGGVERLMDFLFYSTSSINGYDATGHYLRAQLLINLCSTYKTVGTPDCNANFVKPEASSASASSASASAAPAQTGSGEPAVAAPHDAAAQAEGAKASAASAGALAMPKQVLPSAGSSSAAPSASAAPQPAAARGAASDDGTKTLLGYLLGGGS